MHVRTDGWTFETGFIRSTQKSPPKNARKVQTNHGLAQCCFPTTVIDRPVNSDQLTTSSAPVFSALPDNAIQ